MMIKNSSKLTTKHGCRALKRVPIIGMEPGMNVFSPSQKESNLLLPADLHSAQVCGVSLPFAAAGSCTNIKHTMQLLSRVIKL